jgi:hypothetical protein
MLCSVPVFAVMVEDLGERGAKFMALQLLQADIAANVMDTGTQAKIAPTSGDSVDAWKSWGWGITAGAIGASMAIFAMATLKRLHHA